MYFQETVLRSLAGSMSDEDVSSILSRIDNWLVCVDSEQQPDDDAEVEVSSGYVSSTCILTSTGSVKTTFRWSMLVVYQVR